MDPIVPTDETARLKSRATKQNTRSTTTVRLPDGALAEMVYDPCTERTGFCVFKDGAVRQEAALTVRGEHLLPYAPKNNLLRYDVVLFPSRVEEYGTEGELVDAVRAFIHRSVDVTVRFERLVAYYVLLTWVYDSFNEVPYLRVRGDFGSGKTRFLQTVGSVCYKPIFASGASTVSPLFRMLDAIQGTLVLDESDFRMSDHKAELVKILNNGNARGFPVLRTEVTGKREFNPTAYQVFGPKLIATRGYFEDRALESRCITEELGQRPLREDIPITLPPEAKEEALRLRNQLLLFRFRKRGAYETRDSGLAQGIAPRLKQVFAPLLALIDDLETRRDLEELAGEADREMAADRGMDIEARVLEVIRDLWTGAPGGGPSIKEVTASLAARFGDDLIDPLRPERSATSSGRSSASRPGRATVSS